MCVIYAAMQLSSPSLRLTPSMRCILSTNKARPSQLQNIGCWTLPPLDDRLMLDRFVCRLDRHSTRLLIPVLLLPRQSFLDRLLSHHQISRQKETSRRNHHGCTCMYVPPLSKEESSFLMSQLAMEGPFLSSMN